MYNRPFQWGSKRTGPDLARVGGKYPDFVETVMRIVPLYYVRFIGGVLFMIGYILLIYNVWMTIKTAPKEVKTESFSAPALDKQSSALGKGHRKLEGLGAVFTVLVFISIIVGSIIEILPTLSIHKYVPANTKIKPYTPLELEGRDIYISEGCYVCHSQMIRKLPFDVLRYGPKSTIEESMYNRPFQWGSKRTGPDLARVGGKYPDSMACSKEDRLSTKQKKTKRNEEAGYSVQRRCSFQCRYSCPEAG
jgi:cytochrome c oxidase cbb3-type subunit I/II